MPGVAEAPPATPAVYDSAMARHGDHRHGLAAVLHPWPRNLGRQFMTTIDNTIGGQIDRLASETGAPDSFVQRIRELFCSKGISLDGDCSPYITALEHAFRREQSIRLSALQTRENLERLQRQLDQFNQACRRQLNRMQSFRVTVGRQGPTLPEDVETKEIEVVESSEDGESRTSRSRPPSPECARSSSPPTTPFSRWPTASAPMWRPSARPTV